MFGNITCIQRGITWKRRKRDQLFLCTTHCHDLIHIPINVHEDIPKGYFVMGGTRMFEKKK